MKAVGAARPRDGHDLLNELADRHPTVLGVHLQVSDRCNHHCQHCYQVQGQKGEMTLDQVRAVLDNLAEAGVLLLNVSGGEATLRTDLVEILEHARKRGFAVRLFTNAYAVDDALATRLAAVGLLEVRVSVYSDRAEQHDAITRVPGSWERTTAGIRALRARGMRVVLSTPATCLSPGGPEGVERLAGMLGCAHSPATELTPREDGSLAPQELCAPTDELVRIGLLEPWQPRDGDEARRAARLAAAACGIGSSGLTVLPDGSALPCPDVLVPLGNLKHRQVREILSGNPDLPFLRTITWGDVHGCRDCDLLLACRRCHATALSQGGDFLGPYRSACARSRGRYTAAVGGALVLLPGNDLSGRNPEDGPYRIEAPGRLRPIRDRRTSEDDAKARQHPWIRRARGGFQGSAEGGTTGLSDVAQHSSPGLTAAGDAAGQPGGTAGGTLEP